MDEGAAAVLAKVRGPLGAREAAALCSFASRIEADDAGAHNNLGVLYFTKGMVDDAIDEFVRALELDPKMTVAQRNLEDACGATGAYERRAAALEARIAAGADTPGARRALGSWHLLLSQPERAIEQFTALLAADERDTRALAGLAQAERRCGRMETAAAAAERALCLKPADAGLLRLAAEIAYHRGLNDQALDHVDRALSADPDSADAHLLRAFILGDSGEPEKARDANARAARLNPSLSKAHSNLSLERFRGADPRRAAAAPRPVHASHAAIHSSLGLALRQKGYWRDAMREYRKAIEAGEPRSTVLEAMAELHLLQLGRHESEDTDAPRPPLEGLRRLREQTLRLVA